MLEVLKYFNLDKSPEPYKVHLWTMWEGREEIVKVLPEIFASSLATSEFVEDWNVANVIPGNYSLVSLM